MRIVVVGPGRAGTAVGLAARRAGHEIVAVVGRDPHATETAASAMAAAALPFDTPLPDAELLVVAVRDDAIGAVARRLAPEAGAVGAAVHLSGATSVTALEPLAAAGLQTGSFHPLQSLPGGEIGAERLAGAWIAVTASPPLERRLFELARSLGAEPFALADDRKVLYHAAATLAANVPVAALALAHELFAAADVPFAAARPLVEGTVANIFELGPHAALTGPVARGDVGTVNAHLRAVAEALPDELDEFRAFVGTVARLAGASEIEGLVR